MLAAGFIAAAEMKSGRATGNHKGFTLLEIVAVLLIIGVLASLALPKYMDLQNMARIRAAQGAIAEMKGRASLTYAKYLLENNGSSPSVDSLMAMISTDAGPDFLVGKIADGTNGIVFRVDKVQGVPLETSIAGTWILPTTAN